MGRIENTFKLLGASWQVLKADKELLWLPILSGLASIIVAASFILPISLTVGLEVLEEGDPMYYVVLFVMYFILMFIAIFFNAALVHAALDRLQGGDPTVGSAIGGAMAKLWLIFKWAIVAATVSLVLQIVEEKLDFLGKIVIRLIGLAWTLVTFMIVPILVVEDIGVMEALRRSGQLFKKTWGENVTAQIGFGIVGILLWLPAFGLIAAGAVAGGPILFLAIAIGIVWIILSMVVLSALNAIFRTALYLYASGGETPSEHFPREVLDGAFAPKRRRF